MLPRGVFALILSLAAKITGETEHGVFFQIKENNFYSDDENILWSGEADSLLSCSVMCARQASCKSANFLENQGLCCLLGERQTSQAEKFLKREGSFYLEKVFDQ